MLIINIIPAPVTKLAVIYNPTIDMITTEVADVIGLMEVLNPDDPDELGSLPVYMIADSFGVYSPPQFSVGFLEFIPMGQLINVDKYKDQVAEIKKFFAEIHSNTIEVETKGNLSQIKRPFLKSIKKDEPKNDA